MNGINKFELNAGSQIRQITTTTKFIMSLLHSGIILPQLLLINFIFENFMFY